MIGVAQAELALGHHDRAILGFEAAASTAERSRVPDDPLARARRACPHGEALFAVGREQEAIALWTSALAPIDAAFGAESAHAACLRAALARAL